MKSGESSQLSLRVGILADSHAAVAEIRQLVSQSVHEVGFARVIDQGIAYAKQNVDAWIFASQECDEHQYTEFLDFVDQANRPVIYDDFSYLTPENRASSAAALEQKISASCDHHEPAQRAESVWVLAASAGGPEALCDFFSGLTHYADPSIAEHEACRNTAFILAQHISAEALPSLIVSLEKSSGLPVFVCDRAHQLAGACIYIVHPELQVEFTDQGAVTPVNIAWQGAFSPTIDQVMARAARAYREHAGAIIFSGMSNDGAASCRYMKNLGGTIWAQSPESSAVDSMPRSAIKTREVMLSATPNVLAKQFLQRYARSRFMTNNSSIQGHA